MSIIFEGIINQFRLTFQFLIERGNVTTYEWIHGEAPLSIEEPKLDFGNDDDDVNDANIESAENVEIDFDFTDLSGIELEAPVDIDWGDLEGGDADEVKIDWDAVDVVSEVQVS